MKRQIKERHCHICGKICRSKSHWLLHPETLDIPGRKGKLLDSVKMEFLCYNFPKLKNRDTLRSMYMEHQLSLPNLCDYVEGIDLKAICFALKYYGIPVRSLAEARKSDSASQRKIEQTNLARYGKKNPLCKGTEPWNKRNKTVKDKYGVDNVWQCLSDFVDEHRLGSKISSLNIKIAEILSQLGLQYEPEFAISYINQLDYKKHIKYYDFKVTGTKILIEVNGDYWHANPRKYKENDYLKMRGIEVLAETIWQTDKFKTEIAQQNGYDVLVFWESEILSSNGLKKIEEQILERVKNAKS